MEHTTVVGIDVSKDRLDVHVLPSEQAWAVSRDGDGLAELCRRLAGMSGVVALEATGGYESIVAASLSSAGLPLVVVNPAQVRAFAKALGQRAKSDPIDARVIARFVEATKPAVRPLPDQATRMLADLLARRRQIVEMMASEGQRLRRTEVPRVRKSIERLVVAMKRELGDVDHDIDDTMRGSPVWREKEDLLASVPGVGRIIARTMVADLPELGTLGRKQIGALAGLAPFVRQSGKWKGQARIGGGRPTVRTALFIGAQVAKRHNPILKAFYERLIAAGKSKMAATIAVAHKLLTILNAILRDKKPWQVA
jgi:transposase